jgi:hypothetical protein
MKTEMNHDGNRSLTDRARTPNKPASVCYLPSHSVCSVRCPDGRSICWILQETVSSSSCRGDTEPLYVTWFLGCPSTVPEAACVCHTLMLITFSICVPSKPTVGQCSDTSNQYIRTACTHGVKPNRKTENKWLRSERMMEWCGFQKCEQNCVCRVCREVTTRRTILKQMEDYVEIDLTS